MRKSIIWLAVLLILGCDNALSPEPSLDARLLVDGPRVSLVIEAQNIESVRWRAVLFLQNYAFSEEDRGTTTGSDALILNVVDDNDCPATYRWVVNGAGLTSSGERQIC